MSTFDLLSVSSGSSSVLSSTTGSGRPRLYEGDGIYMYAMINRLLKSDDGGETFVNIQPDGYAFIATLCQVSKEVLTEETKEFKPNTVAFAQIAGAETKILHSKSPETTTSWGIAATPASGFRPSDSVSDDVGVLPVLVSNANTTSTVKILRNTDLPPFPTWSESDSGLPQSGVTSSITDLEATSY